MTGLPAGTPPEGSAGGGRPWIEGVARDSSTFTQIGNQTIYNQSPPQAPLPVRYSLRPPTDAFTGRDEEVHLITTAVTAAGADGRVAVHAIRGMPGAGKTALASHVAHLLRPWFPDLQLFIDLHAHTPGRDPTPPETALTELLIAIGMDDKYLPKDLEGLAGLWRDRVAGQRVLLVLDNARDSEQVASLLPGGNRALVLVTSRRFLGDLPPVVVHVELEALPPAMARAMFLQLAPRAAGAPEVAVQELVRLAGHLPLAISLLAGVYAKHPSWTFADLTRETRESMLTVAAEKASVAAAFDVSYRYLAQGHRQFFGRLGLHPGTTIDAYAAGALAGIPPHEAGGLLDALHSEGLLIEAGYRRYSMHDLIRRYVQDRVAADRDQRPEHERAYEELTNREVSAMHDNSERREALLRLLGYYAFMASAASKGIGMHDRFPVSAPPNASEITPLRDEASSMAWFDAELGNLLACAYYANDELLLPFAWQIPASMMYFLRLRGFLGQAVPVLNRALETITAQPAPSGEAVVRRYLGQAARLQGDYDLSRDLLIKSLQITSDLDDRQGLAWCHHELGHLDQVTNDLEAARDHFTEALAINRELQYTAGEAAAETNLAIVLHAMGDPNGTEAAREYLQDALRLAGDSRSKAFALYQLGAIERDSGEHVVARELLGQALVLYGKAGNRHGQADCLLNLAKADRLAGNYDTAMGHLTDALRIYVELGYRRREAETYAELSVTAQADGKESLSLVHRQRADKISAQIKLNAL
jgi:tetratricopeptide (TPR) repeat protein